MRFVILLGVLYAAIVAASLYRYAHPPAGHVIATVFGAATQLLSEQANFNTHDTSDVLVSKAHVQNPQAISILFIGNSYTFINDMPKKMVDIASADADSPYQLTVQMVVHGGTTLTRLYGDNDWARMAIASRPWTMVVLQEQSFWVLAPESVAETDLALQKFDALIRQRGSRAVLFLTWARQAGSKWYRDPRQYGDLRNAEYMQAQLDRETAAAAQRLDAPMVPVGDYWAGALSLRPSLPLYTSDGAHPTSTAAYLNALVFYHHITGRPVAQIAYTPMGVTGDDAKFLRDLVSAVKVGQ